MLCKSLCAFREPFGDSVVESVYPGQEVEVPDELVDQLIADRHIERPARSDPIEAEAEDESAADAPAPRTGRRRRG